MIMRCTAAYPLNTNSYSLVLAGEHLQMDADSVKSTDQAVLLYFLCDYGYYYR